MAVATKLAALVALVACGPVLAAVVQSQGHLTHKGSSAVVVLPEDLESCVAKVSEFLDAPAPKEIVMQKTVDACSVAHQIKARNYACPHVRNFLEGAFENVPPTNKMSAEEFCDLTEFHALRLRGVTRVPNIGTGSLFSFSISSNCKPTVQGAMQPQKKLPKSEVPGLWYSLCVNQDCASLLPSRTKWCHVDRMPVTGAEVCELAREYATSATKALPAKDLDAQEICSVYDGFVEKVKNDVESYDHFVHGDSREHVDIPKDPKRSLQSARMLNKATEHYIRDHAGTPVHQGHSGAVRPAGAAAAALALAAALAA